MDVDTAKQPRNVISFCSGYAGIERGLELTGLELRTLCYVEIEAFAAANLVAKMETGALVPAPVWSNLKTFPAHLFRERVDILTAGYPCQPFSNAGKRAGKDDPRHLWPYIKEHIQAMRPVRCFFENVEGHITLGLREVIEDLESLGYKTAFGIFSASEVGAPHQRKRVYILADSSLSNGIDAETYPQRANSNSVRSHHSEINKQGRVEWGAELQHKQVGEFRQVRVDVADSDSNGQRPRTRQEQPTRHSAGQRSSDSSSVESERMVANTSSTRSSTRLSRPERSDKERHSEVANNSSDRSGWRQSADQWATEPRLGRVVNGCADRVDRIRLLGNGVVPQTAAKAWTVLEGQLWQT